MVIFHSYVSLPEGIPNKNGPHPSGASFPELLWIQQQPKPPLLRGRALNRDMMGSKIRSPNCGISMYIEYYHSEMILTELFSKLFKVFAVDLGMFTPRIGQPRCPRPIAPSIAPLRKLFSTLLWKSPQNRNMVILRI
jgi:hypothetical protein